MDIKLPKLGEGSDAGTVVNVFVKEGDTITKGQTIIELESEKAVAPIPASEGGVVTAIRVKNGDRITVGQVILTVSGGTGGAAAAAPAAAPAKAAAPKAARAPRPVAQPEPEAVDPEDFSEDEEVEESATVAASPNLRYIARELGINLAKIRGSEAGGRIVMSDLRAYIQRLQRQAAQPRAAAPAAVAAAPAKPVPQSIDFSQWGPVTKQTVSPLRATIARRMLENWNAIPHVTQFDDIEVTVITELRKKYAAEYEKKGIKLTVTPFFLKALVTTLKKYPIFNSSLDEATGEVVLKDYYHIGVAVDTEAGLIVPCVRDVDKKSIFEISKDVNTLAEKARDRKITLEEMRGGTFTVSNQGAFGGGHFTPIVNKPEVAILGLGRAAQKPVVRDNKLEIRAIMPVALSYDHRVIDGGTAARFIVDLVKAFETFPESEVKL